MQVHSTRLGASQAGATPGLPDQYTGLTLPTQSIRSVGEKMSSADDKPVPGPEANSLMNPSDPKKASESGETVTARPDELTPSSAVDGGTIEINLPAVAEPGLPDNRELTLRAHVLEQFAQAQRSVLTARSLATLVKYFLDDFPEAFGSLGAELRLHDPEGKLSALLPARRIFGENLTFTSDSYPIYELYGHNPETLLLGLDDGRMFRVLPRAGSAQGAVMMPLFDGERLMGSYHLALSQSIGGYGDAERQIFAMLAQLIASAVLRLVEFQQLEQRSLLHPVTEMSNARAFHRDMLREIFWARRVDQPLSLLYVEIDDYDELRRSYGELACNFALRRGSQRLCSGLRQTDYIAQVDAACFAILLPACNEPHAYGTGERLRRDLQNFAIDDGRGAVLYVSLSLGLVSWDPSRHPVEASERLAQQMEREAQNAMEKAARAGGDRLSVARLGLLML